MLDAQGNWDGYIGRDSNGDPIHVGDVVRDVRLYGRTQGPIRVGRAQETTVRWDDGTEQGWEQVGTLNTVKIS